MAWSLAVKVAINTALLALIDSDATSAASVEIYNVSNVLLVELPLTYPAGTVASGTGQLDLTFPASGVPAAVTGTASYGKLVTQAGTVREDNIPCQAGTAPVAGKLVLSSLSLVEGVDVQGISLTVPAG